MKRLDEIAWRNSILRDLVRPTIEWRTLDTSVIELAHRRCLQERLHRRKINFAVMIICALKQDDHVLVASVITNATNVAAAGYIVTFERGEIDWATVFYDHALGGR
jgi:hypothetical protein